MWIQLEKLNLANYQNQLTVPTVNLSAMVTFLRKNVQIICREYWNLGDYFLQKDFILANVEVEAIKRNTINENERTRNKN